MFPRSFIEYEKRKVDELKKYQLPHHFKKAGIALAILGFVGLFVNKAVADNMILRESCKYAMLIGLLITSISKEQVEDELISSLRMQSYTLAFIAGVALALVQPFINFGVDSIIDPSNAQLKESGDFVILWILLTVQVMYFELLKRLHR